MSRRTTGGPGTLAARALAMSGPLWQAALARTHPADPGPYGPLGAPGQHGVPLPAGFDCRVVARSGHKVAGIAEFPFQTTNETTAGGTLEVVAATGGKAIEPLSICPPMASARDIPTMTAFAPSPITFAASVPDRTPPKTVKS